MRPRKKDNAGLPKYLHTKHKQIINPETGRKIRTTYYYYDNPKAGFRTSLEKDRSQAIEAALTLNAEFMKHEPKLLDKIVSKITGTRHGKLMHEVATMYQLARKSPHNEKPIGERTKEEVDTNVKKIKERIGDMPIQNLTHQMISEFLDDDFSTEYGPGEYGGTKNTRQKLKKHLALIVDYARDKGWWTERYNPVRDIKGIATKRERMRLKQSDFRAIVESKDTPLNLIIFMELLAMTLQRPIDLMDLKFPKKGDRYIHLTQKKTGTKLALLITPQLAALLDKAKLSGVFSPYILHKNPKRVNGATKNNRLKATKLNIKSARKDFRQALKDAGLYQDVAGKLMPTLYECKSMGTYLYSQRDNRLPQELAGHKDAKTTEGYTDGHGESFHVVTPNLNIGDGDAMSALYEQETYTSFVEQNNLVDDERASSVLDDEAIAI